MADWGNSGKCYPQVRRRVFTVCSMPWETWQRPKPGQKVRYHKRPRLDDIHEDESRTFFMPVGPWNDMTDGYVGASWGNGPATTAATDDWTGGSSGGAAGWDDGAANNAADSFNESSTPAADFGGSDDNGGGQGRPQGGCFNCGQGMSASTTI